MAQRQHDSKAEPMVRTTVRLPEELHRSLRLRAAQTRESIEAMVRQAVREYLGVERRKEKAA